MGSDQSRPSNTPYLNQSRSFIPNCSGFPETFNNLGCFHEGSVYLNTSQSNDTQPAYGNLSL